MSSHTRHARGGFNLLRLKKKVNILIYLMPTQFQKSIAFGKFPGFAVSPSGEKIM